MSGSRSLLGVAAGVVVTAGFLWLFLRQLDLRAVAAVLAGIRADWLLLALAALAADYAARTLRWWIMLRSHAPQLPLAAAARPLLAGVALNNLLPFRAGDLARIFLFRSTLPGPVGRLLGTLLMERLLDLSVLLALLYLVAPLAAGAIPEPIAALTRWLAAAVLLTLLLLPFIAGRLEPLLARIEAASGTAGSRLGESLHQHLCHLADSLTLLHSRQAPSLYLLSLLAWLLEGCVFVCVARALQIQDLAASALALTLGTLGTLLPSTPGYLGTFDYFARLGMELQAVPGELAASFALAVHLVLWLPLTLVGLATLLRPGLGDALRRMVALARRGNGDLSD